MVGGIRTAGEHRYFYMTEEKSLEDFRNELKVRQIVVQTPTCPKNSSDIKCSECSICEKKIQEFGNTGNWGELDSVLLNVDIGK